MDRVFSRGILMCGGRRENSGEHILGTKRLLLLELEEHREGDVKGCRLGLSLVKDYLVLPGI